ncbi:TetR/AcrR family transcriptional regulator [Granulicoccus sp. GXG6511]|uniref:TetR/AcrR family transcriptional regulator n=1 Tax=Granulicoccus sp. GXG6511 TaxID=3381351 RepID=UPI003D7D9C7E
MPKIDAATVAEHRARRERQVIEAAVSLLTSKGPSAVTPAAVAQRTGLARTSVYQYAGSSAELVGAAVEALFVRAEDDLTAALAAAGPDPHRRVAAIVRAVLEGAAAGHSPNHSLDVAQLPPDQRTRLGALHGRLLAPLEAAIADSGVAEAGAVAALVWGAINGAVPLLERGYPVERLVELALGFIGDGVPGCRSPGADGTVSSGGTEI